MGWNLSSENMKIVPQAALQALVGECRRVAARAAAASASNTGGGEEYLMRDRILVLLETALEPWLGKPRNSVTVALAGTRDFKLVKSAEALFEQHDLGICRRSMRGPVTTGCRGDTSSTVFGTRQG